MSVLHPYRMVEGLRATRRSMGDGTARGLSRLATPYQRRVERVIVVDQSDPYWTAEEDA